MKTPAIKQSATDRFFLLLSKDKNSDSAEQWLKDVDTLQVTANIKEAIQVAFPDSEGHHQFILEDSCIPGPRTVIVDNMTEVGRLINLPGFTAVPYWQLPQTQWQP